MKIFLLCLATIVSGNLMAESAWKTLFDGKTLNGWSTNVDGEVKASNGEIHILTKKNLWLVSDEEFEDFELELEVLMPESDYNSGVGFRIQKTGKKPQGYQCEVANKKTGAVHAIGKGWILPAKKDGWEAFYKKAGDCFKLKEWNKIKVICQGKRIQIWVNGHQTVDLEDDKFSKGAVALQHHGKGAVHKFRNIRIRKL